MHAKFECMRYTWLQITKMTSCTQAGSFSDKWILQCAFQCYCAFNHQQLYTVLFIYSASKSKYHWNNGTLVHNLWRILYMCGLCVFNPRVSGSAVSLLRWRIDIYQITAISPEAWLRLQEHAEWTLYPITPSIKQCYKWNSCHSIPCHPGPL